jgi:hypothetical protein
LRSDRDGRSAIAIAARRGRGDALRLFEQRGTPFALYGVDRLIAACAKGDRQSIERLVASEPHLVEELIREGGTLLAELASNGNVDGLRCLLDLGVSPSALTVRAMRISTSLRTAQHCTWLHGAPGPLP